MFSLAKLTAIAIAISPVFAAVIPVPRDATPPTGWATDYLEPYITYHARYLALDCREKHDTPFFDQCCHPLLRSESVTSRPAQCSLPSQSAGQSSVPAEEDDDLEDCDEEDVKDRVAPRQSTDALSSVDSTKPHVLDTSPPEVEPSASARTATVFNGGVATYYYQNGVAGACGKVHSDQDMIAAIDEDRYGNLYGISSQCGKHVKITNTDNGKSVTVLIADACPTCKNGNSIDLSEAAFKKLASLDKGVVPITWTYV